MERPTNRQLISHLAHLLTDGFPEDLRHLTHEWRAEAWRTLRECEVRMCPTDVFAARRARGESVADITGIPDGLPQK